MKTFRQLEIEEDLRGRYTGLMTLVDIGNELGIHYRPSIERFMGDTPAYEVNGIRKWRIQDFAKRLADCEVTK